MNLEQYVVVLVKCWVMKGAPWPGLPGSLYSFKVRILKGGVNDRDAAQTGKESKLW